MRLLHRNSDGGLELTRFLRSEETHPKYAILSHTWLTDEEEVSFDDLIKGLAKTKPAGYSKIQFCAERAAKDGLDHFWVDTCCINKRSSEELQESIISMFSWYRNAVKCYVYLTDVSTQEALDVDMSKELPPYSWELAFRHSRWFTRGWTLQELLAPSCVEFFSAQGRRLGDKESLEQWIHEITGIPIQALRGDPLDEFSIAERLSWQENRRTGRKEDKAYCLLGIFNIFMPHLYGEGDHAFARLQAELDKKHTESDRLDNLLSILPVASEAAFNSLNNQHESTCLPNTRTELLQDISKWVDGVDGFANKCVFWLNGIAGTGKSTVARTVARTYHDRKILAASFFFSKGGGELGDGKKTLTTLAWQIATRFPSAKRHICEAIMKHKDIADQSLRDQWYQLIISPLSKINSKSSSSTILLVIDALDECNDWQDVTAILKELHTAGTLSNIRLRIFITSRPEIPIRLGIAKIPDEKRQVLELHEISSTLINRDLQLYFEKSLLDIREERGFEEDWPGLRIIKRLVESSCGLFIWASTACRYIREGRRLAMKRITKLLNQHLKGAGPEKQLDQIYTTVLIDSIQQGYSEEEREEIYQTLREVLGSIVVLFSPLSMDSLATLRGIPLSDIKETLADLHTIFNMSSQPSAPIRLHHPTFRDFLIDKERCYDLNFWVDAKQAHKALADSCLALMETLLKRDICRLGSPGILSENIDPSRIKQCISPELQYACLYWVEHYRQSGAPLRDGDRAHQFLQKHLLHWLEAINLIGKSSEMGAILRLYHAMLLPADNMRQVPFIKDARRFFFAFQSIAKQAPLQIYCAGLAFIPSTNELKHQFRTEMHSWVKEVRIAEADIPPAKDEFNYVCDLAFTPDCRHIAAGSNFGAARLWDVTTRNSICLFEGSFMDKVSSVAISPDGTLMAGGSDDWTIVVWDMSTRTVRYRIRAHSGWINSVFFSPDGKLLASGAMDEMVGVFDAQTGQTLKMFNNQSSCINSATFSPDSSLIATGSVDSIVRLWDVKNNTEELRIMLDGHQGPVNAVKFSPNGKCIVSGSDDMTVKLWDTFSGVEYMTFTGHTKKVMAVAFSLDARLVVSGSEDKSVRVWDASNGVVLMELKGHASGINSVAFSPDGRLLASASFDDEVRVWDTKTWSAQGKLEDFEEDVNSGLLKGQRAQITTSDDLMESIHYEAITTANTDFKGHAAAVTCVVFSPDGQTLATGSQDSIVKLWLREGIERWRFEGHSGGINHVAFSPNSHLVASASIDKTVKVWNTLTGTVLHTLEGHSDNVLIVTFSWNGQFLASCSINGTTKIWDVATGAALRTLTGHTDIVSDLAISPDCNFIASCSADTSILLWSLSTNEPPVALMGHSGPVNSIAFSADGETLVSSSEDATIRLWNKAGISRGIIKSDTLQVTSAAFSPDNLLVASCSIDKTVKIWDLDPKEVRGVIEAGVVVRKVGFSPCRQYIESDRGVLDIRSFNLSPLSASSSTRPHALFVSENWLRRDAEDIIWLPEDYHATSVATWNGAVVLGHSSGSISFIHV